MEEGMLMVMIPAQLAAEMERKIHALQAKLISLGAEITEDLQFSPEQRLSAEKQAEADLQRFRLPPKGADFVMVGPLPPTSA